MMVSGFSLRRAMNRTAAKGASTARIRTTERALA
jgi:hypothetical protein